MDISEKSKMQVFAYSSRDDVKLASGIDNNYGSAGASITWDRIVKNKHAFSFSGIYSKYDYTERNHSILINAYEHQYGLEHYEVKTSITLRPLNDLTIHSGINSVLYHVDLGSHRPYGENSNILPVSLNEEKGLETGIFVDNTWELTPKLALNAGLRYNFYQYLGPQDIFLYKEGVEKRKNNIADTLTYEQNKTIKSYQRPDLRLSGKYQLFPNMSVKMSYNETYQNVFMLSNTIAISPTDKWKLSDYHIKPMRGRQFSGGVYANFNRNQIETSAEVYLKNVNNQVDYKDGADVLISELPETQVLQGELESYGLELMIKKPYGRFNGWLNYTYSNATVHVDGNIAGNSINFGRPYPANHDKPHALNLVANYKFSRRLSISWNTVYSTGRPITFPAAVYYINGDEVLHYSERNEYRLPDYFRMDLSINLEGNLQSKKFAHGSWMFSVYNLTGRKNAYSVFFKNEKGRINGYKMSIFGQPIITITYNFKLGNYAS
jgi:outer membrane receptor protein involved in Fe transport